MLYLIGLGLDGPKTITMNGLACVRKSNVAYLEGYTSPVTFSLDELEAVCGKKVTVLERHEVESNFLLEEAAAMAVALLVMGDPFGATTHSSLVLEAREKGIVVEIVHNASILNAVGETGLSLYKFGRVVSLPFDMVPASVYDCIRENKVGGLHTLCLLDIKADEKRYMTMPQACQTLQELEKKYNAGAILPTEIILGVARLGCEDQVIKAGTIAEIMAHDFGTPPHCIIIPSPQRHFIEDSWLRQWKL